MSAVHTRAKWKSGKSFKGSQCKSSFQDKSHPETLLDEGQNSYRCQQHHGSHIHVQDSMSVWTSICTCTVGETRRTLKLCIIKHKWVVRNVDSSNGLAVHAVETGYIIHWDEAEVVYREQWTKRKIKESLIIRARANTLTKICFKSVYLQNTFLFYAENFLKVTFQKIDYNYKITKINTH